MTKQDIIDRFRQENPEFTDRVLSDSVLESWAEIGELEIACMTRCIRKSVTFSSVADDAGLTGAYTLSTEEPLFFDIDEFPGGGIVYDGLRLDHTTFGVLDDDRSSWRSQSSGTPSDYIRYNDTIIFGRPPSSVVDVIAYLVVRSNAFNDNDLEPFNGLVHLKPYHYSIILYLTKRAKAKLGKTDDVVKAEAELAGYVKWMKTEVNRGIYTEIKMRPPLRGISGYRNHR